MDNEQNVTPAETVALDTAETATPRVAKQGGRPAIEHDPAVWLPADKASRLREGRVVSNKMEKTVVIAVDRLVRHRLYKKIMRRTSKFMAHDELSCNIGDVVRIVETRPLSKRKRWRVVQIVERAPQVLLVRGDVATK
jgi:small subunit ribosomal protein S17